MPVNKIFLEPDGLVVGTNQLITQNGDITIGKNLLVSGQLQASGGVGIGGNLNAGGYANIFISSGVIPNQAALNIVGNVFGRGGVGYHDFLAATSTFSGATNPSKWFRLDPVGNLQIINNTYTTELLRLTDSGNLVIPVAVPASTSQDNTVPTTNWVRQFGGFQTQVVYTNATQSFSNTNATFPAGVTKAKVTVVGGGGSGGGNSGALTNSGGGGGGAGGMSVAYITFVSGAQYWANVGAGGIGVVSNNGGTGNVSTFTVSGTVVAVATGGVGGSSASSNPVLGGAGGVGSVGNVNLTGTAGGSGLYINGTLIVTSGGGAPGYMGLGGARPVAGGVAGSVIGVAGTDGGGGSGSMAASATATTNRGGNGGGGIIIVEY